MWVEGGRSLVITWPPREQTDRTKNITFRQTTYVGWGNNDVTEIIYLVKFGVPFLSVLKVTHISQLCRRLF